MGGGILSDTGGPSDGAMTDLSTTHVDRTGWLGSPSNAVSDAECRWACMISHHQQAAMMMARVLKELLERQLLAEGQQLAEVWLDRTQEANPEGMREGVRCSQTIVVLLTRDTLIREWCIQEIRWALQHRKNIVLVYVTDARHGGVAGGFSDYYRPQIKLAFPAEPDFEWIMRNAYIEFTPDGGHDMLMLRNPKTKRGILDQMRLPEPAALPVSDRQALLGMHCGRGWRHAAVPLAAGEIPLAIPANSDPLSLAPERPPHVREDRRPVDPLRDFLLGEASAAPLLVAGAAPDQCSYMIKPGALCCNKVARGDRNYCALHVNSRNR